MTARQTAGELSIKAAGDKANYDPLEVAHGMTDDVVEQLSICAKRHEPIFSENEFFVILQVAGDTLIKGIRRHKYAAFLHMPKPRPSQTCFLYNRHKQSFQRLWSLPNPEVMARLSEMTLVDPRWQLSKMWCDAFFEGWKYEPVGDKWVNKKESHFFNVIRKYYGINHLSEKEFLNANRHELIQAGNKDVESLPSEPFDFSKIDAKQVVDSSESLTDED